MITFDLTDGKIPKYEVAIFTRDLTIRITYHYYAKARMMFTDIINQHISGVTVYLNDLTGLTDC